MKNSVDIDQLVEFTGQKLHCFGKSTLLKKLEMCPEDTDTAAVAKFAYSQKQSQK